MAAGVRIKQFVTDEAGHKVAAILDIKELTRIEGLLEDLADLRAIEERKDEPAAAYREYRRKRKPSRNV
jgi:hypothetical protein